MKAHEVTSVSSSKINVIYRGSAYETGRMHCTYTFILRNGKIKLKSRTVPIVSSYSTHPVGFNDSYNESFSKNQFIAAKSLTFYKKPNSKKIVFSAKEGDILTLKKIRITDQSTFLQFQKGKQTGWISIGFNYASDWFYGVALRRSVLKTI